MEEQWVVDRCKLRAVWLEHPEWSKQQLAQAVGHSKFWVKKWRRRLRNRPLEDQEVLLGQSRARKRPPPGVAAEVVTRILAIRDEPAPKLGRTPGPVTILYYLQKDQMLTELGYQLPRSTPTIWKILDRNHRSLRPGPRDHEAREPVEPGVEWGMDFHDVSTVPADPQGKQQQVVEILNFVDPGSSAVVASEPGDAYTAETALRTVAEVLQEQGCPDGSTLDREPRWVGSWTARDFPSPLLRFLECLGINPEVYAPHQPQKNPYVERYHRNYKYECQEQEQPQNLESTSATNTPDVHFYNYERPNQALTCGNQPPLVKFPNPPQLSPVPDTLDPDRWVLALTGKIFKRRLNPNGSFQLGNQTYYVSKKLHGQHVTIWVNGPGRELTIHVGRLPVKQLPIQGLHNRSMAFEDFVDWMAKEAQSAWHRYLRRTPTYARSVDVGKQYTQGYLLTSYPTPDMGILL
jgi:transposase InsO family protein